MTKSKFVKTISNQYLGKTKTLKANSVTELQIKVNQQLDIWQKEQSKRCAQERKELVKRQGLAQEQRLNGEIERTLGGLKNILNNHLHQNIKIDWDKEQLDYESQPFEFVIPDELMNSKILIEKEIQELSQEKWFELIFPFLSKTRLNDLALKTEQEALIKDKILTKEQEAYEDYCKLEGIKKEKLQRLSKMREGYELRKELETEQFFWNFFQQFASFPYSYHFTDMELEYDTSQKRLIVNLPLPNHSILLKIKNYKYISSKGIFKETPFNPKESERLYQSIVYQIVLSSLYVLFSLDYMNNLDFIVLNGSVTSIDKSVGFEKTKVILSVQVPKEEFSIINLSQVDYKLCLNRFKVIYHDNLYSLQAILPIANFIKNDSRIIQSREVLDNITHCNLAQMPWDDFEHLVNNLLKEMYADDDYHVYPTQKSRDGGVDGIIYYNDSIRGGKYIVQAKRYNNIVPVSAVRELHSTVIEEEALKGILISTSYYGKDSYEFVKDKRITLINGKELEELLKKYGYDNYFIRLGESV